MIKDVSILTLSEIECFDHYFAYKGTADRGGLFQNTEHFT